ncbi:hypothetical protein HO133_007605 [Letharia lupina]|uniref:Uncharacterized protein n=1 Tax=Letharia lupina TaxID=560253 RepID=A0A8H6CQS3_9LECA|nr:uncharacterized protein HO133_007605 [Letharia lupina]KAF6227877.1 hypothetical protein HO133_007605 [Letharia lupina]
MPSHIERLKGVPRRALAYLLSQEPSWKISADLLSGIAEAAEHPSLEVEGSVTLPSEGKSSQLSDSALPHSQSGSAASSPLPHSQSGSAASSPTQTTDAMDGTSNPLPTEFTLYWQSKAPRYSGDLDTYIWQPYRKPPPFTFVKLHIVNTETPQNLRMILLFKETRSLCDFRNRHQSVARQQVATEAWSSVTELARSILAVCETILSDMVDFLQCTSKEITRLTFEGRAYPRVEKIQYLIHMNDCRKRAELDMRQDAKQLEDVIKTIQSLAPPPQSLDKEIKTLGARTADFNYILKELAIRGTAIDSLQKEFKQHSIQ